MAWVGLLLMSATQVASSAITAPQEGESAFERYKTNCKRAETAAATLKSLKSQLEDMQKHHFERDVIHGQLVNMKNDTADLLEDLQFRKRVFYVKACIVFITCVLMTAVAIFIILRRSGALHDTLSNLSTSVERLQQSANT